MNELIQFLKERKNSVNLLILVVLTVALPFGVNLIRQQQILKSKALGESIVLAEGRCVQVRQGRKILTCADVPLKLTAPTGTPSGSPGTSSPTPSSQSSPTQVKALVLRYFPVDSSGQNIDTNTTGDLSGRTDVSLATLRNEVSLLTTQVRQKLTEGTRYHGFKDVNAKAAITYQIQEDKEFLKPIPKSADKIPWNNAYRPDYRKILTQDVDICNYVDNLGVRQVWMWGYHTGDIEPVESDMSMGTDSRQFWNFPTYGDVSNSERINDLPICKKTYVLYNYNFGRGVGEALEDHGHHIESVMGFADQNLWDKFKNPHGDAAGINHCGWTHSPPNVSDNEQYDWKNERTVNSDCMDWKPEGGGRVSPVSCHTWYGTTCLDDSGTGFKVWWMQNIPGLNNNLTYQGKTLRNWWELYADFDIGFGKGKGLTATSPSPSGSPGTSSPTPTTSGVKAINAKDFPSIQTALDSLKSTGGAVYIPAGTYTITEKIRLFSNTTLFGDGIDRTILQLDSSLLTDADGIIANDSNYGHNNIVIRDMTLRGLSQESGLLNCCPGIKLRQLDGGFLHNIKVEGFSWHGIWLSYKQQRGGSSLDMVKNVRISNCQILNNKGAGIEIDSPNSQNVVDNCTLSGNNSGADDTKRSGAAINLFMDEDGTVTKNKILNNTISGNVYRGISLVARNGITTPVKKIPDNAVCNNTVENNGDAGIADGNSEDSVYIANRINNNNDKRDGKVTTGNVRFWDLSTLEWFTTLANSSINIIEDENPGATHPDCSIPLPLRNIPAPPQKPQGVLAATASPTPSSRPTIVSFKIAESQAGLSDAQSYPYTQTPTVFNYTLSSIEPGVKQIWVEFIGSKGESFKDHINVELVEEDPQIDSISCRLDITEHDLLIEVLGKRFGRNFGVINANGGAGQNLVWQTDRASARITRPTLGNSGEQLFRLILKRADGQETSGVCTIGVSQLSIGAKSFCRGENTLNQTGVSVIIIDEIGGRAEEIVSISKDGLIQGIKTKLEAEREYTISIKAPKGLRRNSTFVAAEGTTVITGPNGGQFILPVGDILPKDGGDGVINSADKAELNRLWGILTPNKDSLADFNRDGRINSFDWACMRYDFGKRDDPL